MELKTVRVENPEGLNVVIGQTHFIKTVEDVHELMVNSVPGARFGVAFCEASGPCLVRHSGTDPELERLAARNALAIGCGHTFFIVMRDMYPLNFLPALKAVPEVCSVFCATSNPVEVVIAENATGRGIMGVIDGEKPRGVETDPDIARRKEFLRKIGYKQ